MLQFDALSVQPGLLLTKYILNLVALISRESTQIHLNVPDLTPQKTFVKLGTKQMKLQMICLILLYLGKKLTVADGIKKTFIMYKKIYSNHLKYCNRKILHFPFRLKHFC